MNTQHFFLNKTKACIEVLKRYIIPKGLTAKHALTELLTILDNDEIVSMLKQAEYTPAPIPELTRPLCCIDLETTGTDVDKDMIVEISVIKISTDGKEEVKTHRLNPIIPIPAEATAVHGITNEMVKDAPLFASISKALLEYISGCDILGFHSNRFDVPFLSSMFTRCGLFWDWRAVNLLDAAVIFKRKEERTLSAGVKFYLDREHGSAHTAEGDIQETKEIFFRQLAIYNDLPKEFNDLALYCSFDEPILDFDRKFKLNAEGKVVFTFGKHKDKAALTEKGFLEWMLTKDFSKDTKNFVSKLLMA